jgi:hypothetical protein
MAEQAAPPDAGQGSEAPEAASPAIDLSPITARLDEVAGSLTQRMDAFEARLAPEAGEGQGDELDADDLFFPEGEMEPEQAQRYLQQAIDQRTQRAVQAAIDPLIERIEGMQIDSDARTLVESYPELADPKVAQDVVDAARQKATAMGLDAKTAMRPGFIELVFQAQRAEQQAAGEVPVGDIQHRNLESAAGASPSAPEEPSIADRIRSAGRRPQNAFWGV